MTSLYPDHVQGFSARCGQCDRWFDLEAEEVGEKQYVAYSYPKHEGWHGRTCLGSLLAITATSVYREVER